MEIIIKCMINEATSPNYASICNSSKCASNLHTIIKLTFVKD